MTSAKLLRRGHLPEWTRHYYGLRCRHFGRAEQTLVRLAQVEEEPEECRGIPRLGPIQEAESLVNYSVLILGAPGGLRGPPGGRLVGKFLLAA